MDMENEKLFKGFSYESGKKKPTIVYGSSKEEILERLNAWNVARTASNQLVTCNIGSRQENGKYENFSKYEVKTGKELSNTYLKLPLLPKEKFLELTEQLKKDGAKYNPFKREWYVENGIDLTPFRKYIPGTNKYELDEKIENTLNVNEVVKEYNESVYGETFIEQPKVEVPEYSIDMQYRVAFKNGMKPLYISTSDIGDIQNMTLGEIIEKLEEQVSNILSSDKDYQIGISTTHNECSIYFRDGRDTIILSGEELDVDFRNLSNNQVEEIVNKYMDNPDVVDQVKNEVKQFAVGESIDVFVANRNQEGMFAEHVQGKIKEVLRTQEIVETLTYVVESDKGTYNITSQNVYSKAQSEVLIKAIEQGLTMEQMELMCDIRFSSAQMEQIRYGYKDGLSIEQVALYSNPLLSPAQMDICRIAQIHGVPFEKIPYSPNPVFDWISARNQLNEDIAENRKELAKIFAKSGFQANEKLVKNLEELNHLTKRKNSISNICENYKSKLLDKGSEEFRLVKEIGDELKQQELSHAK